MEPINLLLCCIIRNKLEIVFKSKYIFRVWKLLIGLVKQRKAIFGTAKYYEINLGETDWLVDCEFRTFVGNRYTDIGD